LVGPVSTAGQPHDEGTSVPTVDSQQTRQRLEDMVAELDRSVVTLSPEPPDPDDAGSPGDADAGGDLADNDRSNAVVEAAQVQLKLVRAALQRLDDGTYGRCVDCGKELSADRLEAKPEAARCMSCQGKAEAAAR
jgi:DnaK suppressor protein